ncbi:MAG TPA: hypothetical protein VKB80_06495, partial [Kofleriaceae bacterium]|nr:hypothetical protein [Kofleriaceae bacterium]
KPGEPVGDDIDVNPTVHEFMQAASDLSGLGGEMGQQVLAACSGIATDLGADDTWSDQEGIDRSISNQDKTGACDAAIQRVLDAVAAAREVNATVALSIVRGECTSDFEAQAKCDAECAANETCDPGTIETRCEPGDLSVQCDASCEADAFCVGTQEVAANCMGQCEAECVGECSGTCIAADGTRTENDPSCDGKCTATCNGECSGRCKIEAEAGLDCGADVHCEGGCTGSFTEPVCTSEFKPPECDVDADCHAACSARAMADSTCEPPTVKVLANVEETPELAPLVDTLEEHLPDLIEAAEAKGPLARSAVERLSKSGDQIADDLGDLQGKELSCVGAAVDAVGDTASIFDVAVEASVEVTVETTKVCD